MKSFFAAVRLNVKRRLKYRVTVINKGTIVYMDSLKNIKGLVSNKRILNISFNGEVKSDVLKEYKIIEWRPQRAKIEVDLKEKNIKEVIANIISLVPCVDFMIESIGIEEIISRIYAS